MRRIPHVDDRIRLIHDIPELALLRGEIGVIRSTWFEPSTAYEVEFHHGNDCTRTLLNLEQLQLAEDEADTVAAAVPERMEIRTKPSHLHG